MLIINYYEDWGLKCNIQKRLKINLKFFVEASHPETLILKTLHFQNEVICWRCSCYITCLKADIGMGNEFLFCAYIISHHLNQIQIL